MTRYPTWHLVLRSGVAAPFILLLTGCPPVESTADGRVPGDAGQQADRAAPRDAGTSMDRPPADATRDAAHDAAHDATVHAAVPGARCPLRLRVGLVQVIGTVGAFEASGQVFDRPEPRLGDYALSDAACGYHSASAGVACEPCGTDEVCGFDGTCAPVPEPVLDASLVLVAGGQEQLFAADQARGSMYGPVTLAGSRFALRLVWADQVVTLEETAVPIELADLAGTISGTYDHPTALDISWTPPVAGGSVYTLIPINHHAGGLTFTECAVDASAGRLHVDGAMLEPLAVVTGLEFQGLQHTRFAAATTAAGCVEIRYGVHQYLSLY